MLKGFAPGAAVVEKRTSSWSGSARATTPSTFTVPFFTNPIDVPFTARTSRWPENFWEGRGDGEGLALTPRTPVARRFGGSGGRPAASLCAFVPRVSAKTFTLGLARRGAACTESSSAASTSKQEKGLSILQALSTGADAMEGARKGIPSASVVRNGIA